jgi:hypothetical protein
MAGRTAAAAAGYYRLAPVPQMVPGAELLFLTPEWQELEARSLAQLDRGEALEFGSFQELARWLLSAEDDD